MIKFPSRNTRIYGRHRDQLSKPHQIAFKTLLSPISSSFETPTTRSKQYDSTTSSTTTHVEIEIICYADSLQVAQFRCLYTTYDIIPAIKVSSERSVISEANKVCSNMTQVINNCVVEEQVCEVQRQLTFANLVIAGRHPEHAMDLEPAQCHNRRRRDSIAL